MLAQVRLGWRTTLVDYISIRLVQVRLGQVRLGWQTTLVGYVSRGQVGVRLGWQTTLVSYASVRLGQVRLADYIRELHQVSRGQVTAQTTPPSHNQYHDLVILPFLVNGMSLLCKPSKFPPIWWVASPAYIIHQNFFFWNFHQSYPIKNFLFWKLFPNLDIT